MTTRQQDTEHSGTRDMVRLAVVVGALGVVFGDIGTSPIYTLQTVFNPADPHPVPTLPRRWGTNGGNRGAAVLAALGILGAALFFGDSMITPAISVLSAVEGLKVVNESLEVLIIPVTAVIIVVLFTVQRRGTAAVGRIFGMAVPGTIPACVVCHRPGVS